MKRRAIAVVLAACSTCGLAKTAPFAWRLTVEEPDGRVVEATSAAPRADIDVSLDAVETADGWTVTGRVANKGKGTVTAFEGPVFEGLAVDKARSGLYVPDGFGRRVSSFAAAAGPKRPSGWKPVGDGAPARHALGGAGRREVRRVGDGARPRRAHETLHVPLLSGA